LIRVRDNGIGIPEHELPYIFDRFHQVDGAVAHVQEGTGIGLSLVKELVELHHGTITVYSEPGKGSEFIVALPKGLSHFDENVLIGERTGDGMPDISRGPMMEMAVLHDDEEDWNVPGDMAAPIKMEVQAGERPRVMIVDDNPDLVDYVTMALMDEYAVLTASNGEEALEKAHRFSPDLIISDVMMPGMDGYSLCRELKAAETLRHIPVIMLTARASQDDKIEGLEAGSDDYMAKPFSTRELRARVQKLLVGREQQRLLSDLNVQLTNRNDELKEASEMKSQLLNIAAHDMKNPLNAIREFAQILKSEVGEQSHVYDPLDLIHKSSDQMLHLVSSLLESSAIEEGKIVLEIEPLNVNTLAAAIVRRNSGLAKKKGQTLELAVGADRCLVGADKNRLLEAMDNLVDNAVKYSPLNKTIRISVTRTASSVQFSVQDEGPGLTDLDKQKLFGKFQKLSAQPTGNETSTGLGLAIVKQIIEMHDGEIFVESEFGKGSTFTIDLPILSE
ncbi:MAG: ATP-binding protein, partial [Rhodothermales bacterium]